MRLRSELAKLKERQLIATNEGTHGGPYMWRKYLLWDGSIDIVGQGKPGDGCGKERTFSHEPARIRQEKIKAIEERLEKADAIAKSARQRYIGGGMLRHPFGGPSYPLQEDLALIRAICEETAEQLEESLGR